MAQVRYPTKIFVNNIGRDPRPLASSRKREIAIDMQGRTPFSVMLAVDETERLIVDLVTQLAITQPEAAKNAVLRASECLIGREAEEVSNN